MSNRKFGLQNKEIERQIRSRFPDIILNVELEHAWVDWFIDIPKQSLSKFDLHLNQQCDLLQLSVNSFCLEWFPINKEHVFQGFMDTVLGLLSGEYRIAEYVRKGKGVGGNLQRKDNDCWKTIGRSYCGILPRTWFSQIQIIQNL